MLTDVQLKAIMPNLPAAKLALYLPHLNRAMQTYGVVTAMRTAAFVAQLAHESGEFRWMEEIWGPTQAQRRYEPACSLATRLGNAQAGDGKRFKGRGPIQITGFYNYKKYGDLLGIDLCADPALAASPEIAFATAGLYWQSNGLNELADAQQFVTITRRINGGTNGLEDRQKYFARAKDVLQADREPVNAPPAPPLTRGGPRAAPLTRGHEMIIADAPDEPAAPGTSSKQLPAKKAAAKKAAAKKTPAPKAAAMRPAATPSTRKARSAKSSVARKAAAVKAPTPKAPSKRAAASTTAVAKTTRRTAAKRIATKPTETRTTVRRAH